MWYNIWYNIDDYIKFVNWYKYNDIKKRCKDIKNGISKKKKKQPTTRYIDILLAIATYDEVTNAIHLFYNAILSVSNQIYYKMGHI